MWSLLVVALFFLMILAPCIIALGARRDMAVPGDDDPLLPLLKLDAAQEQVEPVYAAPTAIEVAEAEVLAARQAALLAESMALAAEARLAMLKARLAADHATLASRAASQAAEAVDSTPVSTDSQVFRTAMTGDSKVVDGSELPESHPSMDFPRSRVSRRAA